MIDVTFLLDDKTKLFVARMPCVPRAGEWVHATGPDGERRYRVAMVAYTIRHDGIRGETSACVAFVAAEG
jgi:hypothetical protein